MYISMFTDIVYNQETGRFEYCAVIEALQLIQSHLLIADILCYGSE